MNGSGLSQPITGSVSVFMCIFTQFYDTRTRAIIRAVLHCGRDQGYNKGGTVLWKGPGL